MVMHILLRALVALTLISATLNEPAFAEEATDDQQQLLGFMGKIRCIAERDGQTQEWEWERIKQFIEKDGYYNKELGRFSWQPAVVTTVNQIKLALQERNCQGVNDESLIWRHALRMTTHLNRDGTPQPGFFGE